MPGIYLCILIRKRQKNPSPAGHKVLLDNVQSATINTNILTVDDAGSITGQIQDQVGNLLPGSNSADRIVSNVLLYLFKEGFIDES